MIDPHAIWLWIGGTRYRVAFNRAVMFELDTIEPGALHYGDDRGLSPIAPPPVEYVRKVIQLGLVGGGRRMDDMGDQHPVTPQEAADVLAALDSKPVAYRYTIARLILRWLAFGFPKFPPPRPLSETA